MKFSSLLEYLPSDYAYFDRYPIVPLMRVYGILFTVTPHIDHVEKNVFPQSMKSLKEAISAIIHPAELELLQRLAQREVTIDMLDDDEILNDVMVNDCLHFPFPEAEKAESELLRIAQFLGFPQEPLLFPLQYVHRVLALHVIFKVNFTGSICATEIAVMQRNELHDYFRDHPEEEIRTPIGYAITRMRNTYSPARWNKTKASCLYGHSKVERVPLYTNESVE